jgi:class 3 adenylate cyclase
VTLLNCNTALKDHVSLNCKINIAAWLRGLDLERYERAFRHNDIDADLLGELTADERRQITVMFGDLVGSTALSGKLDLEDLREVLGSYHAAVSAEVARFDGFVAKFMGDGVLIYFGYPQAHEDDAERAIRTALAIVEWIKTLRLASGALAVRVGIATGVVIVGDLIGSGKSQERGILGETPNLASRLQGLA